MNLTKLKQHEIPVFGDINYRGECPSEMAEQVSFLAQLKLEFPELWEIAVHIENEGKRNDAARKKQQGMRTGASDIVIPCCQPILIELKRKDHTQSSISGEQIAYLVRAKRLGAFACVALGAAGAMEAVLAWRK
jgi:hypothetical protein